MISQIGRFQANLYMHDLTNCAKEFHFKAEEVWKVGLVTNKEKSAIEKKYFPTISVKILPKVLLETFDMVKEKLSQAKSEVESKLTISNISIGKLSYLIAFNPKRER